MAVYGYARVSTQAQAREGESLEVQQRQIEGWCHMNGVELDEVFVEEGVSGSVPVVERPRGSSLWARLKPGDTVVAAKLDRLFRSALDALQTVDALKERRVSLVLLDLGGDISGNGLSKLFLTIAAAFSEAERDRIKERIAQVKRDQRERGRYLGGKVPFGFRVGPDRFLVPDPGEQVVVCEIRRLAAERSTVRKVQDYVLRTHGRKLSLDALSRIMREGAGSAETASGSA